MEDLPNTAPTKVIKLTSAIRRRLDPNPANQQILKNAAGKVFKIQNLNDIDATLIEPASCAAHGIDQIAPAMGSSVLIFGSGPTGLVLAQMLRQTGGCRVVIVAPEGLKMDLAQSLDAGDEYITLSRQDPVRNMLRYVLRIRMGLILSSKLRGVSRYSKIRSVMFVEVGNLLCMVFILVRRVCHGRRVRYVGCPVRICAFI